MTGRLLLRPMAQPDVDSLWAILSDPRMWWYDPSRRHTSRDQTTAYVARAAARWATDGLSYWTVHLAATGEVVGSGGAQRHRNGEWNLNYRIAPAHQGQGLAGELLSAALTAAAEVDPTVPCIAWVDDNNSPSARVAERGGLTSRGLRAGGADGVPRLAYSDRPLDDAVFPPRRERAAPRRRHR